MLTELINRCIMPSFEGANPPEWLLREINDGVLAVSLNVPRLSAKPHEIARLLRRHAPNLLVATDEEAGDATRIDAARGSLFPGNAALGVADDVDLTRTIGRAIGARAKAHGINLNLAPYVNVKSDPEDSSIGNRSFGTDPSLVARHSAALVYGMQASGIAAGAKYFPVHSDISTDPDQPIPQIHIDMDECRATDLPPFHSTVSAGVKAVVVGHVMIPTIDHQPASISSAAVRLLRGEVGFEGVIISDALDINAFQETYGLAETGVRALEAGVDLLSIGPHSTQQEFVTLRDAIIDAVSRRRLSENRIVEASERVSALAGAVPIHNSHEETRDEVAGAQEQGLVAARQALRTTGDVRLNGRRAVVYEFGFPRSGSMDASSSLLGHLRKLDPVGDYSSVPFEAVPGGDDVEIVLAYRDIYHHPEAAREMWALASAYPDAIGVVLGSGEDQAATNRTIRTFGSSFVSLRAAAEALLGKVTPRTFG